MFYAALDIFTPESCPEGYRLLCMIAAYLRIDSLIGLDVHTDETLALIEEELVVFGDGLKVLRELHYPWALLSVVSSLTSSGIPEVHSSCQAQ